MALRPPGTLSQQAPLTPSFWRRRGKERGGPSMPSSFLPYTQGRARPPPAAACSRRGRGRRRQPPPPPAAKRKKRKEKEGEGKALLQKMISTAHQRKGLSLGGLFNLLSSPSSFRRGGGGRENKKSGGGEKKAQLGTPPLGDVATGEGGRKK